MFSYSKVSLANTGLFSRLVLDYINGNKDCANFYDFYPNMEGYESFLKQPDLFNYVNRGVLCTALKQQALSVENTSEKTLNNIQLLANSKTFTICTGHQLCLYTGPLFFVYKILTAINQTKWLKSKFPAFNFVPVYWMASEDHDLEEINHTYVFGKKISWETQQKGACGNYHTNGISDNVNELENLLGNTLPFAKELTNILRKSYSERKKLSDAFRHLVNELFGEYGLVIIDGNHTDLKKQAVKLFENEVLYNKSYEIVTDTNNQLLARKYEAQVNPREINCFYINDNIRERIIKENEQFHIVNTSLSFSFTEMKKFIHEKTQFLSPNVVTRPLYQQLILPNIVYVGGPGEIAYWLQYKKLFREFNLTYPILHPRKSILIIDKKQQEKIKNWDISIEDIFLSEQEIIKKVLKKDGKTIELKIEKERLKIFFEELLNKVKSIDTGISSNVLAELQRNMNYLQSLEEKLNRNIKQKEDTKISQIKNLKSKLFPEGVPQERVENMSAFYAKLGREFLKTVEEIIGKEADNFDYLVLTES